MKLVASRLFEIRRGTLEMHLTLQCLSVPPALQFLP